MGSGTFRISVRTDEQCCGSFLCTFLHPAGDHLTNKKKTNKNKKERNQENLSVGLCCSGSWVCFGMLLQFFFFFSIDRKQYQTIGSSQQNRGGAHPSVNLLLFVCLFVFFSLAFFFTLARLLWMPRGHRLPGDPEDSHIKMTGMLVVSLRDVNCRFWSHSAWLILVSLRGLILIFRLACSVPCDLYRGAPLPPGMAGYSPWTHPLFLYLIPLKINPLWGQNIGFLFWHSNAKTAIPTFSRVKKISTGSVTCIWESFGGRGLLNRHILQWLDTISANLAIYVLNRHLRDIYGSCYVV